MSCQKAFVPVFNSYQWLARFSSLVVRTLAFDQLVHVDWTDVTAGDSYGAPPRQYLAGEAMFLADPRDQRTGVILCQVFDAAHMARAFAPFDALHMASGPVALLRLREPLPSLLHASFRRGERSMVKANLERVRSIRARTLGMVEGLSQAQLDYSPAPDTWSIGEVADHLILSENITRRDIAELIELTKAGRQSLLYRSSADFNIAAFFLPKFMLPFLEVPFNFLNMFVPDSVRELFVRYRLVPARAADATTPRKGKSAAELHHGLRSSIEETEALFDANPSLDYDKMIHQHPLLGTQNVPRLLYILGLHEQRHQAQISDLLTDSRLPMAGRDVQNPRLSSPSAGPGPATRERA